MGENAIRVLLVEDDRNYAILLGERFGRSVSPRFEVIVAERLSEARACLTDDHIDAVLLDLMLPDSGGLRTFSALHEAAPNVPVVVLTGLDDEGVAVAAVQAGAQDYLVKGKTDGDLLVRSIRYAIERNRLQGLVRAAAILDDLTGLLNRRGFLTVAGQQLKVAERSKRAMVLFFVDIDNMKWINDTFGHQEGDRALIETAQILRDTFRDSDVVARLGGDEFTILAIEATRSGAEMLLQRLTENLRRRNEGAKRAYSLSLSIGVASCDGQSRRTIEQLIRDADTSMYEQKKTRGAPHAGGQGDQGRQ